MSDHDWNGVFPEVPQSFHEAMLHTLDTGISHRTDSGRGVKKRVLIVLAAAVAALGVTAAAAYVIQWNAKVAERFGADERQQSKLASDGAVDPVNRSATGNGLTVTALQTLGDKNGIYVLFDVAAPEGIHLSDENFFSPNVDIGGSRVSWSGGFADNRDKTGSPSGLANERYYELWLNNSQQVDLNGKTITVDFGELLAPNGTANPDVVVAGHWELSWTLSYLDSTRVFAIDQTDEINGHSVVVNSVELSPLSIKINLSGDGLKQLIDDSDLDEAGCLLTAALRLQDGTEFSMDGGPGSEAYTDTTYTLTKSFGKILNVEQVDSLSLAFPWEGGKNTLRVPLRG